MQATKTGLDQYLTLPGDMIDILRWHVDTLPDGVMHESDLLFPSEVGGYRSPSCLDKPFKEVSRLLGLKKHVTPRAMRRTFQDLARAAEMKDVVTRAVCGHVTAAMTQRYSTVGGAEMQRELGKLISLAGIKEAHQQTQAQVVGKVVGNP